VPAYFICDLIEKSKTRKQISQKRPVKNNNNSFLFTLLNYLIISISNNISLSIGFLHSLTQVLSHISLDFILEKNNNQFFFFFYQTLINLLEQNKIQITDKNNKMICLCQLGSIMDGFYLLIILVNLMEICF